RKLLVFAGVLPLVICGTLSVPAAARSSSATTQQKLVPNPASISFGSVQVSSTKNSGETLTNASNSKLTVSQATVTGAGFSFSGVVLTLRLTPGQSLTLKVRFSQKSVVRVSVTLDFN